MSGGQSSSSISYGNTGTGTDIAPTTNSGSSATSSAQHGRALTACLVSVNVTLVALIYFYFWRLFFRKRSAAGDEEDDPNSSSASTPAPSPLRDQNEQRDHDRLIASLPTFVVRAGEKGQAVEECAVCIVELRDGDEARALPRCGHRFHAACVDAWLRRQHTTCPLCRASVVLAEAGPKGGRGGVTDTTVSASPVEYMDAPV
ncbi:hypothetical protein PR202_gb20508 [Eleusine coracana subsp. coracana]|uniref:RING-type domain-containing protein n=1 Tax=Eleusine coracana subsp. coracana TaxID=191504 RepID=A0AAV5FAW6_ELECO|nr:hypothetical protein PR202_gb20508 [Eleusine coracana subsp. coracana]